MESEHQEQDRQLFFSMSALFASLKDGTYKEILDDWKWIMSYTVRYKGAVIFYLVLGLLSTSLGLVSSVVTKYMIDIIIGRDTGKLSLLIAVFLGSGLTGIAFNSIISRISAKLDIDISHDIQGEIFDHIIDADWLSLSRYSTGDILNRFGNDIGTISGNAINWLPRIVISIYQFLATFFLILHYDKVMALISLASAPFLLMASKVVIGRQREYGKKTKQMNSRVMHFEMETFQSMDTIKALGITGHYSGKLREWQKRYRSLFMDYNLFSIKTSIFMSLVGMGVEFAAMIYCLFLLWKGSITYGTMTLFLQQRSALSGAFGTLAGLIPSFLNSSVSAHRVRELMDLPRKVRLNEGSGPDVHTAGGFTVEMQDVTFAYREGDNVIRDSAFRAAPGEIVALVGPSGEGKTTMVRLILGMMQPGEGSVVIKAGGRITQMNASLRHLMTYVPQGNTILTGTIAENLRSVREDATDEEVIEALKTACAWDFVSKLSEGINASVGERGRGLSEGQAQRIAIARAVLRDAPIILMDEATSALDVATERRVLNNIMNGDSTRTVILTTHKPTVLNICTRVYKVMDTSVMELTREEAAAMAIDF